ncbi:hypothetical protein GCM10011369_04580 [Neiella marina]|uniref:Sec-independent protein translocase protein TatA n=1 Tax=Neiella marina TaxID=508461 RepID=A0A8J2U2G4_9GAMM|nr:twin-arginine translocase TatA/TatE family subunit [Neiella marina]GGA66126.1 hypothetical protein GCM10011369_04580 [Neiella marina]
MAGVSVWQLAIIAVIVALLFGTKRLRGFGGDLGSAIKGFKQAAAEEPKTGATELGDDEQSRLTGNSTANS